MSAAEKFKAERNEEIFAAISAFEQILEAIPNDRTSLEALANAYEQLGERDKAKEYAKRLASVLIEEADFDSAKNMLETLKKYIDDPEISQLITQIEMFTSPAVSSEADKITVRTTIEETEKVSEAIHVDFDISEELSFAWNLVENKLISQEEYAMIVQDLTEMSSTNKNTTVSVLHVLEQRAFKNINNILISVAKQCGTPLINLSNFDIPVEALKALPLDFIIKKGAVVFEFIGSDILVAVLNPFNSRLRREIENFLKKKCHFYFVSASEFDKVVEKIKKL